MVSQAAARELIAARMDEDSELLPAVIARAEQYRWLWFHDYDPKKNRRGFPDLMLLRGGVLLIVELKSHTGRVRKDQQEWLDRLSAVHARAADAVLVYVWRPLDLLDGTVDRVMR